MKKLLSYIAIGLLITQVSCVDDWQEFNPPRQKDGPQLYNSALTLTSTVATFEVDVADAPGLVDSVAVLFSDYEGATVTFPGFDAIRGTSRGSFTVRVALAPGVDLEGTVTVEVYDAQSPRKVSRATLSLCLPPPSTIYGTYSVVTNSATPASCNGSENTVTITSTNNPNVLRFSDITGGMYLDCYGAADNPASVNFSCNKFTVVDQPDVVYGGDVFNGNGTFDIDSGVITIIWRNNYGDRGTTVFTKQ